MSEAMQDIELRVLAGPQAGARAALTRGQACAIASWPAQPDAPPADVLLRGAAAFSAGLEWIGDAADAVQIRVQSGSATMGGTLLAAGAARPWAPCEVLSIGEVTLAYGPAHEAEWTPPAAQDTAPPQGGSATPDLASAFERPRSSPARLLVAGGCALVLIGAALAWLPGVLPHAPPHAPAMQPTALQEALQGGEFQHLKPMQTADGRLVLSGALDDAAQRARLETLLKRLGVDAQLNLRIDEQLAAQVVDVFRLHGVAAEAELRSDGTVHANTREADGARVAQAERAARRDVAGLAQLQVHNQPPPKPRPAVTDDPGKRITAVVEAGDAPYFTTADGSRYFVGAVLPSGHKVVTIEEQTVTVEREGQLTRLTM